MGYVAITDDSIWAKQIEGGKALKERILSLAPGETIELGSRSNCRQMGENAEW